MAFKQPLRRGLLYVPGSSRKMLDKSADFKVDCVVYDLEDSVIASKKADARAKVTQLLGRKRPAGIREQAVRINSLNSRYALNDLYNVLKAPHIDTVVVPKVQSAADLRFVSDLVRHHTSFRRSSASSNATGASNATGETKPEISIIALIESAKAITDLSSICKATPLLSGLIFAAEDFALDLSLIRTPSLTEFLYARSALVTACRANNLPSVIDLVCTQYKGEDGEEALKQECLGGKQLGFNGKQLIHPNQVEICQEAFSPSDDEIAWALRIVRSDKLFTEQGKGAWALEGKMVDAPVIAKGRAILEKAQLCGKDVEAIEEALHAKGPL